MDPRRRRPIVTADLAVFASSSVAAARLRDAHLWPVIPDAMTLIRTVSLFAKGLRELP